jgi:Importin-beta N-terminal domain.
MQNNNIIDEVVGAIRIFTNPPKNDKHSFKEAEKYLVNFEKEPQAWLVASKILDSDNYEKVVYIHASSILKKKLQYDSYQMSTSDAVPLAEAIISNSFK